LERGSIWFGTVGKERCDGIGRASGIWKGQVFGLVQSVQKFVSQRGFVTKEGACFVEKVVAGILLEFRVVDNHNNSNNNTCRISAPLCTFRYRMQ
jgi:hypothetical protein